MLARYIEEDRNVLIPLKSVCHNSSSPTDSYQCSQQKSYACSPLRPWCFEMLCDRLWAWARRNSSLDVEALLRKLAATFDFEVVEGYDSSIDRVLDR